MQESEKEERDEEGATETSPVSLRLYLRLYCNPQNLHETQVTVMNTHTHTASPARLHHTRQRHASRCTLKVKLEHPFKLKVFKE